jgi:hypothetical protein
MAGERHGICESALNLPAINRLGRKAANILGANILGAKCKKAILVLRTEHSTACNMTFLAIITFLLQALVSLV